MRKKVVVVGGGVAGLSAAHELAQRGFDVEVYERRETFGGKAASTTSAQGLPGEHGFRFFPGWYRHLPDTMKRIPYKDGKTVFDNLVPAGVNLFASYQRDPVQALLRLPSSWSEAKILASFPQDLVRLGLTLDDVRFFVRKLLEFARATESQRLTKYESISWWDFMEAPARSDAFRNYLVDGITRNTVAAKAQVASAYTIARVALRTIVDLALPGSCADRVLNAPTNEAWLTPWLNHLRAGGVTLIPDAELDSIAFDGDRIRAIGIVRGQLALRRAEPKLEALRQMRAILRRKELFSDAVQPTVAAAVSARRTAHDASLHDLLKAWPDRDTAWEKADRVDALIARLGDVTSEARAPHHLQRPAEAGNAPEKLTPAECAAVEQEFPHLRMLLSLSDETLNHSYDAAKKEYETALAEVDASYASPIEADYFIFALPVEQMAYYVRRSPMLTQRDPSLSTIIPLSEHVDWMSGIQFYLTEEVEITRGHIDCLDSEWHLTAISQAQFWPKVDLSERGLGHYRGKVKAIVSVDISAWDRPGQHHRKEAFDCNEHEIAEEVWSQLKRSLNRANRAPVLRDDMLLGWTGQKFPDASFYLDTSIVDRFDRKKQAFYQKFESVRFSAPALLAQERDRVARGMQTFAFGNRRNLNAEPLLINRAGGRALRPSVKTRIPNLFLAADYVVTHTDLATMEAANEAARVAVNEIVLASGVHQPRCDIWPLSYTLDALASLESLLSEGERGFDTAGQLAIDAAQTVSRAASKAIFAFLTRRG